MNMKKKICLSLVMLCLLFVVALLSNKKLYLRTGVITEIHNDTDTFIITDLVGNDWEYEGIEDWTLNDAVVMIMNNNGTEDIIDDSIVSMKYNENFEK